MQIKKILNNNVIITVDGQGREIVAMGCGIAFNKKVGDHVPDGQVDKVYTLSNHDMLEKFKMLLADISLEYLEASNEIIELAEKKLDRKLNEVVYISLTDHLHMAVERFREGTWVRNMLLWEIERFYPEEFAIGKSACKVIYEKFGLELPEDEAGFIALHIIDAESDSMQPMADHIMHMIQELLSIVRYTCDVEFDRESLAYYRFITHLKFFAQRVFSGQESHLGVDEEMQAIVRRKYGRAYLCAKKITEFMNKKYHYNVSADERFYLMIHIAKVTKGN
jgi:beta-glucoside operon transcriptional antiterminator